MEHSREKTEHTSGNCHDHGHVNDHGAGSNKKKFAVTILLNAVITLSEFIGGFLSGSLALVSDAWHNLSDVLSLILGYAGERVSEAGSTKKFSFGLKRFEVLIALINSLSLIAIGGYIVYEAVMRFQNPEPIAVNIMIPVACIGLVGNVISILVLGRNREDNLNLKAAFLHLLYDAVSSVAVIAAGVIIYFTGLVWLDLAVSLVIVLMIVWSTAGVVSQALKIFLQGTPSHIDSDEVYQDILDVSGVGDLHGLHIWSISSREVFLSCHITIPVVTEEVDTDAVIYRVNRMLDERYGITHTTLQVERDMLCDPDGRDCCR